jgi:hypothetical protein
MGAGSDLVGLAEPAGELAVQLVVAADAVVMHVEALGVGMMKG